MRRPDRPSPAFGGMLAAAAMMRPLLAIVIVLGSTLNARIASAAPSCAASCVERMRTCRADRCPDATGTARRHCRDVCRAITGCAAGAARTRTIATVVNECRSSGRVWTGRQRLEIRRGDCAPVTVMTIEADAPATDVGVCAAYGSLRAGAVAEAIGAFEGVAVSEDGETVLFQVTDDFPRLAIGGVELPAPPFTLPAEGIFVVRSDGGDLRLLAHQSREPPFAVFPREGFPPIGVATTDSNGFSFSPDGRSVAFIDRGPGTDGSDAPQVFTLDVATGTRQQLTDFTAAFVGKPLNHPPLDALFLDDRQIGGVIYVADLARSLIFRVRRDGTALRYIDPRAPAGIYGAAVVPTFRLSGGLDDVFEMVLGTQTDEPIPGPVHEVFVQDGSHLLQLTRIGRSDTRFPLRMRDDQHVLFAASGDPTGKNPALTCQLFTVDVLGGHLRQLTPFAPETTSPDGCARPAVDGCTIGQLLNVQDQANGTIVFDSSCAAFGSSAVGAQVYAVRPDGSGFRRLTDYRGMTVDPDGAISVELPGPVVYQAPLK